jgi:chromosome partitioning protein
MRHLLKEGLRRLTGTPVVSPQVRRPLGNRHAQVIAVATQKGGVGKTTTSVNLAAALARHHGREVLLLDLDPQGHVARALSRHVPEVPPSMGGLSAVLLDPTHEREVMDVVVRTSIPGLSVGVPDPGLRQAEDLLATRIGKEFVLRDALKVTRSWYDVIVIDCPPNLGNLSVNGLVAADVVLAPCDPSPLAVSGVEGLVRTVEQVAARLNPDIDVLGVLLTRVDGRNTKLNQAVVEDLTARWGEVVLPVQIGVNAALAQAQQEGTDIFGYDAESRGAQQYLALADLVAGGARSATSAAL